MTRIECVTRSPVLLTVAGDGVVPVDEGAVGVVAPSPNVQFKDGADAVAIGANWYPNAFIKYYVNYERTSFENDLPSQHENLVIFRAQVAF